VQEAIVKSEVLMNLEGEIDYLLEAEGKKRLTINTTKKVTYTVGFKTLWEAKRLCQKEIKRTYME